MLHRHGDMLYRERQVERMLGFSLGFVIHTESRVDLAGRVGAACALGRLQRRWTPRGKRVDNSSETTFETTFDAHIHSAQSLTRACYSLSELGVFRIESGIQRHSVVCTTRSDRGLVECRLRAAAIDFAVRESIEARTHEMRNLIWKTAFAEARGTEPG